MPTPRLVSLCVVSLALACGRTEPLRFVLDGGHDAGHDAGVDAGHDAGVDAGVDAGPAPCVPGTLSLTRARATLLFVIDRSGSMDFAFGASTRWNALRAGLGVALPPVDQSIATGAYLFPVAGQCAAPLRIDLPPATGNANAINMLLTNNAPLGGTPTADALVVAANALRQVRAARSARALVLATDGAPGCNFSLDPFACVCGRPTSCGANGAGDCLDDTRTIARMAAIADAGLPTWVIGIQDASDLVLTGVLNRMAVAGGRPQTGTTQYYPATNPTELDSALVAIRDQVGHCTYLSSSVPDRDGGIQVTVNGAAVPEDPLNGWYWADRPNGELQFVGTACQALPGDAVVSATVECSTP